MFYSTHDLCDQIHPSPDVFVFNLIVIAIIPIFFILQITRIIYTNSTVGISPTSVLLRTAFCTINFANAINLPYTFAAVDCCHGRGLNGVDCFQNILVVIQAGIIWFFQIILAATFLVYHIDTKPTTITTITENGKLSIIILWNSFVSAYPPWTPNRSFILTTCLILTVLYIPFSIFYLVPIYPTNLAYWTTLEAWSYILNFSSMGLAILQGIPQIRLITSRKVDLKEFSVGFLIIDSILWFFLAGAWTTWFGKRLYSNINLFVTVMWIIGAEVYLNYLVIGMENLVMVWKIMKLRRGGDDVDQENEVVTEHHDEDGQQDQPLEQDAPDERTPLLSGN